MKDGALQHRPSFQREKPGGGSLLAFVRSDEVNGRRMYVAAEKNIRQKSRRENAGSRRIHLNIGIVIYLAVFLYLIIRLILYFTETHISSYQVVSGPLSSNETYTALALREETVVYAAEEGSIRYYIRDGAKTGKNSPVCRIGNTENTAVLTETTKDQQSQIRKILAEFAASYDPDSYSETDNIRYEAENVLLGELSAASGDDGVSLASADGTVVYATDGYESYKEDDIREEWFDRSSYQVQIRGSYDTVQSGDPIYKIVTDEAWKLAIQVTDSQFAKLSTMTSVKVKFLKDGQTQNGTIETKQIQGKNYAFVTLQNGMARYAQDRFLQVELVTNIQSGLKIPNTSIVKKEFYRIPAEYRTVGGDSNTAGVLREVVGDNGSISTEFVSLTLYTDPQEELDEGEKPACYYVDTSELNAGDVLVVPDSQSKYTVKDTETLKGVFNINQGYAVFRLICVLDQNDEFTIVEEGTSSGIDLYDYIVADASAVEENQIME